MLPYGRVNLHHVPHIRGLVECSGSGDVDCKVKYTNILLWTYSLGASLGNRLRLKYTSDRIY